VRGAGREIRPYRDRVSSFCFTGKGGRGNMVIAVAVPNFG
jgi:hypothetical protein